MDDLQVLHRKLAFVKEQCGLILKQIENHEKKRKFDDGSESNDENPCKRQKGTLDVARTSKQNASEQYIIIYSRYCTNQKLSLNDESVKSQLNYIKDEFKENPTTSIYLSDIVTWLKIKNKFLTRLPRGAIRALLSQVSGAKFSIMFVEGSFFIKQHFILFRYWDTRYKM